ncbi:GNAT family N-acetyltransferase [Chromohalobacter canadensis]|uniref:GNAT family N-acetyltransferase n=1 Tax=Chromohalobacter canadensis TaxID=141389 RepID=UPI00240FBB33|nr:GNAT family N-acetyltransferase [Chromohalobacter canadensis]
MSDIIIDTAQTWDIPQLITLRSLLLSGGDAHYAAQDLAEEQCWQNAYRTWLEKQLVDDEPIHIAVARQSTTQKATGCAIGLVNKRVPGIHCPNGLVGWIQTVVVDSEWRELGLGRALIQSLLEWFTAQGVREVTLETTPGALRLYTSMGFEPSGEDLLYYHPRNRNAI